MDSMLVLGPKPGSDSFSALVLEASGVLPRSYVGWAHTRQTRSPTSQRHERGLKNSKGHERSDQPLALSPKKKKKKGENLSFNQLN